MKNRTEKVRAREKKRRKRKKKKEDKEERKAKVNKEHTVIFDEIGDNKEEFKISKFELINNVQ